MSSLRACAGCGAIIPGNRRRCPRCTTALERGRGSRQARGIDRTYDRLRPLVLDGATACAVCGGPFTEDNPATLGHIIPRSRGGTNELANLRAECARCNYGHAEVSA